MSVKEVIEVIRDLSYSQGFYGRLLRTIKDLSYEQFNDFKELVEKQNFKEPLDVVMFFET